MATSNGKEVFHPLFHLQNATHEHYAGVLGVVGIWE